MSQSVEPADYDPPNGPECAVVVIALLRRREEMLNPDLAWLLIGVGLFILWLLENKKAVEKVIRSLIGIAMRFRLTDRL